MTTRMAYVGATPLLSAVTGTGAGDLFELDARIEHYPKQTYQAVVSGSGSVSATVKVQVSNDGTNFLDLGTITLSGTTSATDGFASDAPWCYRRGNVTAISGTSAKVTLTMGA